MTSERATGWPKDRRANPKRARSVRDGSRRDRLPHASGVDLELEGGRERGPPIAGDPEGDERIPGGAEGAGQEC